MRNKVVRRLPTTDKPCTKWEPQSVQWLLPFKLPYMRDRQALYGTFRTRRRWPRRKKIPHSIKGPCAQVFFCVAVESLLQLGLARDEGANGNGRSGRVNRVDNPLLSRRGKCMQDKDPGRDGVGPPAQYLVGPWTRQADGPLLH